MKARVQSLIIILMMIFSSVIFVGDDAVDADTASSVTSTEDVVIPYNGSKVVYLTTNLTAFSFNQNNDGLFMYIYQNGSMQKSFSCTSNGQHQINWPDNTTWVGSGITIDIVNVDSSGRIAFQISLTKNENTNFTIELAVISYGLSQGFSHQYNVIATPTTEYSLEFSSPVITAEGIFISEGTLYYENTDGDKVQVEDVSNYSFYAKGLYRGVAIQDDLTIRGRIDTTDSNWSNYTSMTPTIIVSKQSSDSNIVLHPTITYSFNTTIESIEFSVQSQSGKIVNNESLNKNMTVLSSDPITITVYNGTEALILYDNGKDVIEKYVVSAESMSSTENLSNQGTGSYVIKFTHPHNTEAFDTVTVLVIASLIPTNSIHISCGPSP